MVPLSQQTETWQSRTVTATPEELPSVATRMMATPTANVAPTNTPASQSLLALRQRLGVCGAGPLLQQDLAQQLGAGWFLDWGVNPSAYRSPDVTYVPMIRLKQGEANPRGEALLAMVDALPGALWLIGNEPDVKWQDNVSPEVYAGLYHDLYHLLKGRDPSCRVAIGGVSQPTPLRLRYLDQILEAYKARYGAPMPVDVWNVHNFILREERDGWGVDIPPGMTEQTGALREISDHDNLAIFREQIVGFRRWMLAREQRSKPLIVTEYGILMPRDYGFPLDKVEQFMVETFEFFRTASDSGSGYPADGNRLVQRWCWFSLADKRYPTGNLVDADSGALTPLGEAFSSYAHGAR
jgi:hypothetical protein